MTEKRTYYPAKTFDDDLANLAGFVTDNKLTLGTLTGASLKKDGDTQRSERAQHDASERAWKAEHETFGTRQEDRYQRFAQALNAARALYRNDKIKLAELDQFKRSIRRAKKAEPKV